MDDQEKNRQISKPALAVLHPEYLAELYTAHAAKSFRTGPADNMNTVRKPPPYAIWGNMMGNGAGLFMSATGKVVSRKSERSFTNDRSGEVNAAEYSVRGRPIVSYCTDETEAKLEPEESDVKSEDTAALIGAEPVSANHGAVLGTPILLGRWVGHEDEPAAVISYALWQRLFHGDPYVGWSLPWRCGRNERPSPLLERGVGPKP